jgi:hypothetical protein
MFVGENPLIMGQITGRVSVDSGHTPVINTYLRDDVASADVNAALGPTQRANRRITLLQQNDTTTYANATDLAVAITRLGGFSFEFWLAYVSTDATEGIGVQLAFSGTANGIAYSVDAYTDPATRAPLVTASAFGSGLAPFAAGPGLVTPAIISVKGGCNVTAVGDLNLQFRAETGGAKLVALLASSWAQVWAS